MGDELSDDLLGPGLIDVAIDIVENADLVKAKLFCGTAQLRFTDTTDSFESGVRPLRVEPAAFAACRTHEIGLDSLVRITCQGRSESKCLVIRMREDCE
jgi:hypothetical protein